MTPHHLSELNAMVINKVIEAKSAYNWDDVPNEDKDIIIDEANQAGKDAFYRLHPDLIAH